MKSIFEGIDPLQLIIWGILLVAYGVYSSFRVIQDTGEVSVFFRVIPFLVITFFGIVIIMRGYRDEKERKDQS